MERSVRFDFCRLLIQAALEKMHRVGKIPKEMAYSVKVMDKSTQRMLRLINQLLEFRKMQNNKLALSLEETDVISFLYEIYLSFKDAAESKKMDFRFIPSVASYKMFIDKGNLDKVTYNLLSNAFKYTPSGGKIDFSVQVDVTAHKLVIKVTDSGVGIPKEKRDQLFKRFMQTPDKEEAQEENLPVVPLNKRKLLIIEDDTDVREFLKEELSVYFEVVAEADGNAGLERAYSYDADLIICDVLMPGLSGFEVTRKLKSDFNTSHIPIILLTALNAPESHLEGVESGADAYITKPQRVSACDAYEESCGVVAENGRHCCGGGLSGRHQ